MRRFAVLIYVAILLTGLYFAYQWNSSRAADRVRIIGFAAQEVKSLVIERGGVALSFEPDKEDGERWIFATNANSARAYSIEASLVLAILDSLRSAPYAYLVEASDQQSLQRYGLGQQERYNIRLEHALTGEHQSFVLGALAVNGYDIFLLNDEYVYRAAFVGLYEHMAALGRVVDIILDQEHSIF